MMKKRLLCVFLVLTLALGLFVPGALAAEKARTLVILQIDGSASMTKGTSKSFTANEDMKLAAGYTVSTGAKSYVVIKADDKSLITLDERSKIQISKAWFGKLSLSVLSGGISVDAAPQNRGESVEIRVGNSALTIRGTEFVAENGSEGPVYTMLSGSGEVAGQPLGAGQMTSIVPGPDGQPLSQPVPLALGDGLSLFALRTILEKKEALLASGVLKESDLELLDTLIEQKQAERDQEPYAPDLNEPPASTQEPPAPSPDPTPAPTPAPTNPPATQPPPVWTPSPPEPPESRYTLTYNLNGAQGTPPQAQNNHISWTIVAQIPSGVTPPAADRAYFMGWNTKADGTGTYYTPGRYLWLWTDTTLYAVWGNQNGSEEAPYQIATSGDLRKIGTADLWGTDLSYVLTADITIPRGFQIDTFSGTLDGAGYTVTVNDEDQTPLFDTLTEDAIVFDLTVTGQIVYDGTNGNVTTGGVANQNHGLILRCTMNGTVEGFCHVGGIVGTNYGSIYSCIVTAPAPQGDGGPTVEVVNVTGTANVGGIVGRQLPGASMVSLYNCHVIGTVKGAKDVGGIVGYMNSGYVEQCSFTGDLTCSIDATETDSRAGGIAGICENGSIDNCYAIADITTNYRARDTVGGIVGLLKETGNQSAMIAHSYFFGDIDAGAAPLGGIAGIVINGTIMSCVTFDGTLTTTSTTCGRIAGSLQNELLLDNYSIGIPPVPPEVDNPKDGTVVEVTDMDEDLLYADAAWDFTVTWVWPDGDEIPELQRKIGLLSGTEPEDGDDPSAD